MKQYSTCNRCMAFLGGSTMPCLFKFKTKYLPIEKWELNYNNTTRVVPVKYIPDEPCLKCTNKKDYYNNFDLIYNIKKDKEI